MLVGSFNEKKEKEKAFQQELALEKKRVEESITVKKKKAEESLALVDEFLVLEKKKTKDLVVVERRKVEDALQQLNVAKEKGKAVITPTDEELADLKQELERKNLEFAQQIDEVRIIVDDNDELNI